MNKFLSLAYAIAIASTAVNAQDFHFSQFYNFPAAINPAQAGRMREDVRAGLIYRSQWKQVNSPYTTFGAAADMNFVNVPAFFDKIGAGILFVNDELPDQIFKNQQFSVSLAMHKSLDAFKRHRISVGFQPGYTRKSFNNAGLYSSADIDRTNFTAPSGSFISKDLAIAGGNNYGAFNLNAGLFYDFTVSEKLSIGLGGSLFNITAPKESVAKNINDYDPNRLGRRLLSTFSLAYQLNDKFTLLPAVMYMRQSGATDLNMGTAVGYHLNTKKDITVYLGGWYRLSDAAIAMVGMQYKHVKVAFSYDATVSSLNDVKTVPKINTKAVGAYEITLTYVGFLSRALPNEVTVPCRFF